MGGGARLGGLVAAFVKLFAFPATVVCPADQTAALFETADNRRDAGNAFAVLVAVASFRMCHCYRPPL